MMQELHAGCDEVRVREEGAARAADVGGACDAVVVGGADLTDALCATLAGGAYRGGEPSR